MQGVEDIGKLVHDSEWKPIGISYLFNNHEIDDSEHGLNLERGATSKEDCQWHIKEDTLMVNAKEENVVGNNSNLSNFCYEVECDIDMQEQARNKEMKVSKSSHIEFFSSEPLCDKYEKEYDLET